MRNPAKSTAAPRKRLAVVAMALMCLSAVSASRAFEPTIRPRQLANGSTASKQPGPGSVPVLAHQATADSTDGALTEANRQLVQKYEQALQAVSQQHSGEALALLQEIVDATDDGLIIDPKRPTATGLKVRAEQLIAEIVHQDRDAYERGYGGIARALYNKALAGNNAEQLHSVASRFFRTRAGTDAAYRLVNIYFDRDELSLAAAWNYRLLGSNELSESRRTNVALQLAVCELHLGNADVARAILIRQRAASRDASITSGNGRIAWFDAAEDPLDWLREKFALDSTSAQTPALRAAGWKSTKLEADSPLAIAISAVRRGGSLQQAMPAPRLRPIAVGDVVVARALDRIVAVEAKTGSTLWESPADEMLDLQRPGNQAAGRRRPSHIVLKLVEQRLDHDSNYGTITSDGRRVFSIDGSGLAFGYRDARANQYVMPSSANQLVARDLTNGNVAWKSDSADTFFLGAPTTVGGELYVLADVGGQTRLSVLQGATGEMLWSQSLVSPGFDVSHDFHRRLAGLAPVIAGDVVVCPTGTGSIVAVNRTSRSLLWSYTPPSDAENALDDLTLATIDRHPATGNWNWLDSSLLVSQNMVISKPRGSGDIHCLDLRTGSLIWKRPCEDALFAAGIANGNLIVVHPRSAAALRLSDGTTTWTTALSPVAGYGFIKDAKLLLPLATGEIATIDPADGRLESERNVAKPDGLGNLTAIPGGAISETAFSLQAFLLAPQTSDVAASGGLPIITPNVRGRR